MNSIPEVPNTNGAETNQNISSSNGHSSSATSTETYSESSSSVTSNGAACGPSENLKIIGHLKNIEKINETRRVFLNNTISEYSSDEKTEQIESTINEKGEVQILNEQRSHKREQQSANDSRDIETSNSIRSPVLARIQSINNASNGPRSPTTPPPKPPMLSRTRSIGSADNRSATLPAYINASPVQSPPHSPYLTAQVNGSNGNAHHPIMATTVTSAVIPEPSKVTTIKLEEDTPMLRRTENTERRPMSVTSESCSQISVNHYERLIEELKCPGCASPMKSPVYLCQTGHSVCEQCTRVLIMCPLCKVSGRYFKYLDIKEINN